MHDLTLALRLKRGVQSLKERLSARARISKHFIVHVVAYKGFASMPITFDKCNSEMLNADYVFYIDNHFVVLLNIYSD